MMSRRQNIVNHLGLRLACLLLLGIALAFGFSSFHARTAAADPLKPPNGQAMTDLLPACSDALLGDDQRPDCDFSPQDKNTKNPAICFVLDSVHTVETIRYCGKLADTQVPYLSVQLKNLITLRHWDKLPDNTCYTLDSNQNFKETKVNCNQAKCDLGNGVVCAAEEVCLGTDELPETHADGQVFGVGYFMLAPYGEVQRCPAIQVGNDNVIWYDTDIPDDSGQIQPTIYRASIDPTDYALLYSHNKQSTVSNVGNPRGYQEFYDAGPHGSGNRETCSDPSGNQNGNADSTNPTQSSLTNAIQVSWGSQASSLRTATAHLSNYYGLYNSANPPSKATGNVSALCDTQSNFTTLTTGNNFYFYSIDPDSPFILASGQDYLGGAPTVNNDKTRAVYDHIIGPDSQGTNSDSGASRSNFSLITSQTSKLFTASGLPGSYDLFVDGGGTKQCQSTIALQLSGSPSKLPNYFNGDTQSYTQNAYIFPMDTSSDAAKNYKYDAGITSGIYTNLVKNANNNSYNNGNGCAMTSFKLFSYYHAAGVNIVAHTQFSGYTHSTDKWDNTSAMCGASGQLGYPGSFSLTLTGNADDSVDSQIENQTTKGCGSQLLTIDTAGACTSPGTGVFDNGENVCGGHGQHVQVTNHAHIADYGAIRTGTAYGIQGNSNGKNTPVVYDQSADPDYKYKLLSGNNGYQIEETNTGSVPNNTLPRWPVAPPGTNVANPVSTSSGVQLNSTSDSGDDTAPQIDCHVSFLNPLSWFLCPLAAGLESVAAGLDDLINGQLYYDTSRLTDTSNYNYQKAFDDVRDLSLGLIGVGALVAVVSQAAGMEILDAYTIRKVLPRLFICTIGISLAWPLMIFFINLTNDLGVGVRQIIYLAKGTGGTANQSILSGGGESVAALLSIPAITDLGFVGLMSFAGTAALAAAVAYLVLVIRQMVITVLVVFAPIAIAAYLLPNTSKGWKLWWESFSKALLMFPMISALIAIGRVFASYANDNLVGFVAYFAPYFLIPLTFRFAGGLLGTLGGFVNDRSRGAFDRLKKSRSDRMQHNRQERKLGTRFEGKSWLPGSIKAANALNEATKGLGTGVKGRFGLGKRGAIARGLVDQQALKEAQQDPNMQAVAGWNDVNRVLAEGMGDEVRGEEALVRHLLAGGDQGTWRGTREQAEAQAKRAVMAAKAAGGFTKARGIAAYYNMARDGTAIKDTDDLTRLAAIAGQGDRNNTFKYAAEGASISRQVGRSDLAAASEPIGALAFAQSDMIFRPGQANGLYTNPDDPEGAKNAAADIDRLKYEAWRSGAGGEVAYTKYGTAKSRTIKNDTEGAFNVIKTHLKNLEDIRNGVIDQNTGQVVARKFEDSEVQNAAAMIVESQAAIRKGYGKLDNRTAAQQIIDRDENQLALKTFMDMPAGAERELQQVGSYAADGVGIYASGSGTRLVSNADIVGKIAGDRMAGLSEAQRQQLMQQQGNQNQQNENENP